MGKQLVGALVMFVAIACLIPFWSSDTNWGDANFWQNAARVLVNGIAFLVLFGIFFIGLKVFAVGLRQEWAGHPVSTGPGA